MGALSVGLHRSDRIIPAFVFLKELAIIRPVSLGGRKQPLVACGHSAFRVDRFRAEIHASSIGSRRDQVPGADIDQVEFKIPFFMKCLQNSAKAT
jgi:hypothetical protein